MISHLKQLRETKNITIHNLALKTQIDRGFLKRLENEEVKELRIEPVKKLMKFFNCNMNMIFNIELEEVLKE